MHLHILVVASRIVGDERNAVGGAARRVGEQQALKVNVLKRRGGWPGQRCSLAMAQRADLSFRETTRVVRGPWSGSTG